MHPDPSRLPRGRRPGWKLLTAVLLSALTGTVILDQIRQAQAVPRDAGPSPNHAHAMVAMLTARGADVTKDARINATTALTRRWESGTSAPTFTLPAVRADRRVALGELRGGPVVLVFGSLTCIIFHEHVGEVERLYRAHRGRAAWLFVNVTEARHTIPGYEFLLGDGDLTAPPPPLAVRRRNVARGLDAVGLSLPAVIDDGRTAEAAYDAYPLRLVALDAQGKFALDLGRGLPQGNRWNLGALERWLEAQPATRRDRRATPTGPAHLGPGVPGQ